jgi:hypothetical protein
MEELSTISESKQDTLAVRQTRRTAATGVWYFWVIGVVTFALSAYFFTHPDIWGMNAEQFYVMIFGGASVLSIVAGAYTIYSRPKLST